MPGVSYNCRIQNPFEISFLRGMMFSRCSAEVLRVLWCSEILSSTGFAVCSSVSLRRLWPLSVMSIIHSVRYGKMFVLALTYALHASILMGPWCLDGWRGGIPTPDGTQRSCWKTLCWPAPTVWALMVAVCWVFASCVRCLFSLFEKPFWVALWLTILCDTTPLFLCGFWTFFSLLLLGVRAYSFVSPFWSLCFGSL